jgi:hypothetical protein
MFNDFLNLISIIYGIFKYFFNLSIVGVESGFSLIALLMGIDKKDNHAVEYLKKATRQRSGRLIIINYLNKIPQIKIKENRNI